MPKEIHTLGMRDARLSTPLLQRNLLLAAMSADTRLRMLPHADLVQLKAGQRLDEPVRGRRRAYFPLTAVAHLCRDMPDGTSVQVAMVGSEGVVGLSFLAGDEARGIRSLAMMPGAALAIDEQRLAQEFRRAGTAMQALLRYTQWLMGQMAQIALCNRHHSIEQQLSRWLLMTTDRLETREVQVTQEVVAGVLGVRREGVNEAASRLTETGVIDRRRGCFIVRDAPRLAAHACQCYAVLKADHESLIALRTQADDGDGEEELPRRRATAS